MDVITAIRKERSRMILTINDCENLSVSIGLFRERPFTVGDPIDQEEYDQWLLLHQYRQALEKAVAFLAARARSRREIEEKLLHAGYRPATVEMVLYKLEKENLLNDGDFARQWVESRAANRIGRTRIAQELRRKGVSTEEAEAALNAIDDDDQLADAVSLTEHAYRRAAPDEDVRKTASRLAGMLARRGYSWDIAREAIQQVMSVEEE